MKKIEIRIGSYGMELIVPQRKVRPHPAEIMPAGHGINDCGRHYNIFEPDEGFPQDRFFETRKETLKKEVQ